jgi:ribose-phosphate pyrophosphokinase
MVTLIAGGAHPGLANEIASLLGVDLVPMRLSHYPDAEVVRIDASVRGADVYLIQPTPPPPEGFLVELMLIADAAARSGAARVTAVVPYLGYSRQDRRAAGERTAVGARVVANILGSGSIDRLVTVDLHQPAVEGFFAMPVEHLEAFPLLLRALGDVPRDSAIVAPDLGAAKLADRFAAELQLPMVAVHKTRLTGVDVVATRITGDVEGLRPIIVDDMITTGSTVRAAVEALTAAGSAGPATVVVTHGILSPEAPDTLTRLGLGRLLATDSVPVPTGALPGLEVVSLAPLLADAIQRLHDGRSLAGLRSHR